MLVNTLYKKIYQILFRKFGHYWFAGGNLTHTDSKSTSTLSTDSPLYCSCICSPSTESVGAALSLQFKPGVLLAFEGCKPLLNPLSSPSCSTQGGPMCMTCVWHSSLIPVSPFSLPPNRTKFYGFL